MIANVPVDCINMNNIISSTKGLYDAGLKNNSRNVEVLSGPFVESSISPELRRPSLTMGEYKYCIINLCANFICGGQGSIQSLGTILFVYLLYCSLLSNRQFSLDVVC